MQIFPHVRRSPSEAPFTDWLRKLARPAADQAAAIGAWGTAATYYQELLSVADPDPADQIGLHLLVAQALQHNHDLIAARQHLYAAIDLDQRRRMSRHGALRYTC